MPDRPLDDWDRLLHAVPQMGYVYGVSRTQVTRAWDREVPSWASGMGRLLTAAQVTPVTIEGVDYEILGWERRGGGRTGWLCPPPTNAALPSSAHPHHAELLGALGGIFERWQEPTTWLSGSTESLLRPQLRHSADFLHDHTWRWEEDGLELPIDPAQWYSVSDDANGNATLCHRVDGDVLRWAPHDDFYTKRQLEDCPEGTLYRIDGTPDFRLWVEQLALQWLTVVWA
ncbi:hypothetical protein V3N99_02475 [Dermatophilaceae bacterium Soc4.6]